MSSIPLVALGVRPPDIANPTDQMAKAVQLRSMIQQQKMIPGQLEAQQQENQARQQENQIRGLQIQDEQALRDSAKGIDWTKPDAFDKLVTNAQSKGVSPGKLTQMAQQRAAYQEQLAKTDNETLKADATKTNMLLGHIDAIKSAKPEERASVARMQASQILQAGLAKDPQSQQMLQGMVNGQNIPTDQDLDHFEAGLTDHKTQVEQQFKERETKASESKAASEAERLALEKQGIIGPASGVDRQELADFMRKNPGKGPVEFAKFKASLAPQATMNVQLSAGGGLTKEAVDQQAENYWNTGKLPPSRGAAGIAQNRQIMNRAAELHSGESLAAGSAEYKANADSLKKLTGTFNNVTAFENTAGKNLDNFLAQAQKAIDTGLPILNMPARAIAGRLGSDQQAAFDAARTTALTEISKVLSSANASSGVVSDSARHEVESLIKPDATLGQIMSAAKILKQDMGNRHQAYADQIETIKKRLGSKSAAETGFTLPPGSKTATGPNGHKIAVVDGKWVDAQTGKPI